MATLPRANAWLRRRLDRSLGSQRGASNRSAGCGMLGPDIVSFVSTGPPHRGFPAQMAGPLPKYQGKEAIIHELSGQDPYLPGLWRIVHVHRGRSAVPPREGIHQRAEA